ncbi:golgi membrane protein, partial [Staphylotrichum tortipilum]
TLAVLNPFSRIDQHLMDDSDLAGPLFFFLLYGTFLLLSGRVHFGYIYGLAVFGSFLLHGILSLMAPATPVDAASNTNTPSYPGAAGAGATGMGSSAAQPGSSSSLTFTRSSSVLGYCLLPLVATGMVGIFVPMDGPLGITLTTAAIMWCTWSASGIFCAVGGMKGMRALVAYPLGLFYVGFGIIAVFSSRGSGSFARVAGGGVGA